MSETTSAAETFAGLVRVVHQISLAGAQELRAHGLTPAQYQVLVLLHRRPRATQRELTEVLGVTKGNVSQLLSRLAEAGLLDRTPEGAANRVGLTDRGRRLVRELIPAHQEFLNQSFSALDDEELGTLARLVTKLEARL
ncbi:MarR family winged helix-turn-helix transcriptional regulator [Micromonospora maritima]|uniref:MarR family winged helix-turn-helix transcriptional regulator n=1 Tax=Micromonospora maritima TaxID=986711 RepID=A0ABW7ZK84_9ACTN